MILFLLLLAKCDGLVFQPDFVILLFVVAHEMGDCLCFDWVYIVKFCCCSQSMTFWCFDLIL